MILKLGINKKGINGDVDSYAFNEKFSFCDIEEMKRGAIKFIENIPLKYIIMIQMQFLSLSLWKL